MEGQTIPPFLLEFISGKNDANTVFQGKILVVNVWATWCPPCREEMPGLERLSKTLDPKRFVVMGVSIDDDAFLMAEFLEQYDITFANVLDKGGALTDRLGLQAYPETWVIASDRTLLRRMTGRYDWDSPDMISMLDGLDHSNLQSR